MIKLEEQKKTDFEQDLYEAKVEEALAKWEAAKQFEASKSEEGLIEENKQRKEAIAQSTHLPCASSYSIKVIGIDLS